jgi:FKBP-type peptidyl-prolyl cis-trans isomerase 2
MSTAGAHSSGATESGDLVRIEYDLWAEGGGRSELIDTTHEDVANQANVPHTEGQTFGPRPHVIGGEYFPTAVENALIGVKIGEEIEREFPPADAFGERDPKLIELFSMHEISRLPEMRREDAHLDLGTVLTIDGRRGRVVTLTAARVRVDFNRPYAGRKVRGKFKVLERIGEPAEQARAIVELQYGRSAEFEIELHDKTLTLKIPDRSKFDIGWMASKPRVIDRLRTTLKPHTIRVVEEYVTPIPEKKEDEATKSAGAAKPVEEPAAPAAEAPEKPTAPKAPRAPSKAHSKAAETKPASSDSA